MDFLSTLALLSVFSSMTRAAPPNVILFVLDDMPFLDQWKESAPADIVDLLDTQFPTPHIDAFRKEAVIFPKSYCGGPKCAPSRFSLLTGRQPARCQYIGAMDSDVNGPTVTVQTIKMTIEDAKHSIPYVLQKDATTPYHTGMVGKWHLSPYEDDGLDCLSLDETPDADKWDACTAVVKDLGFAFVDAWFYSNIVQNADFSHNPEWMVERSQAFIEEAQTLEKPFFLYFASTLAHSPTVPQALQAFDCSDTPKGKLPAYETPDDRTTMWPRQELWDWVNALYAEQGMGEDHEAIRLYATFMWIDQMFGALIDYLKLSGVYDDTFVMLSNDHGMESKGLLYQQGTRIFNFVRYPPRFGKDGPNVLPSDFVVSNVDMAATIFELAGVAPPSDYVMDGKSYLADVSNQINHPDEFAQSSCLYKMMDIEHSHSIVSGNLQYIFRATDTIDEWKFVRDLTPQDVYPNVYDLEQLYDLEHDPSQQTNIFNNPLMTQYYASDIAKMQSLMRQYIADICDVEECVMPELMFETSEPMYHTNVPATPAPTEQRCCYATDLTNNNALKCYDIGDNEVECELKESRWGCAYGQGTEDCAVPTPEPAEAGCCVGSSSKCDTDDESKCDKFAERAGCEWRSGEDADCTPTTSEPGCCFGTSSKCDTDDEAICDKFASRAGCEWRKGTEPDLCAVSPPEPGCCFGSSSKCDTDDEAKCDKFAARAGCEWRSGDDADCDASFNDYARERVFSVFDAAGDRLKGNTNIDVVMVAVAVLVLIAVLVRIVCLGKAKDLRATDDVRAGKAPKYGSVYFV